MSEIPARRDDAMHVVPETADPVLLARPLTLLRFDSPEYVLEPDHAVIVRVAQERWLRVDLAANKGKCIVAEWHHPLYTSGPNQSGPNDLATEAFWDDLYAAGATLVLNVYRCSSTPNTTISVIIEVRPASPPT